MLTLARRVVVMDFGIARSLTEQRAGTVAGTPAYMSPEQAAGMPLDARADVFSAAVVLTEMMSPEVATRDGRKRDLGGATAGSAAGSGRSMEPGASACAQSCAGRPLRIRGRAGPRLELLPRALGRVEESPYPGLLHFTEENARFFVGRELEVESLLRRLHRPRLRAVIGPSGAGKSSFLRAGLLPALGPGWSALVCTPGDRPLATLAQTLAPELAGDAEAVRLLPRFDDPARRSLLGRRWRARHDQALLVVDQAEGCPR